jgi:hypothetical protein
MAEGNTSSTEIAPTQQTQPQNEADLISDLGQAFQESLSLPAEGEEPKKTEAKPAEAETPAVQEAEASTDEAESESETEEQPEEDQEKQPATVKLDAKANALVTLEDGTEVPLKELISGSLRQQDYTRKTQELSSNRKALEDAAQRFVNQDRQVKEFAEFARKVVESYAPKPPDPSKINTDPIGYLQEKEAFEKASQTWRQLAESQQSISQRLEASEGSKTQEQLEQETKALVERLPALATPEGWRAFKAEATDIGGRAYGFAPEEIEGIRDHRYVLALKDAIEYRKLQAKKMEAVRAAKNAPPPVAAAARPAPNRSTQQTQKVLTERARKTGSVEDIAALLGEV